MQVFYVHVEWRGKRETSAKAKANTVLTRAATITGAAVSEMKMHLLNQI